MDVQANAAAWAEADILFSVCFQVCGSFGAGAEKPASDDAGTGKRLEPETGFCAQMEKTERTKSRPKKTNNRR